MPIQTGSVLERLCADVDKHRNRVVRATRRVEDLREQYKTAHWSQQRQIAGKGFRATETLTKAKADPLAAERALAAEESRLLQTDSFLRFG
jgi:hypothetical protein